MDATRPDRPQARPGGGLHRLAVAASALTFALLTAGGFVTSLDAGMVFPDWPLSNGSLNPEGWTREPDKLSEHGHRILGIALGLCSIALAWGLQRRDGRRFVRVLGWVALASVSLQGLLGGLRVTEVSTALALLHGCTGQAVFCMMVALAYLTSRDARAVPEPGPDTRGLAVCAAAVLLTVFLQVVLGAQLRHVGGPLQPHLLGALCVAGTVLWLFPVTLLRHAARPALVRPVLLLGALLVVQVTLGFLAADALGLTADEVVHPEGAAPVLLPSFHQATGGLLLAAALVTCLRAVRRIQPEMLAAPEAAR